MLKIESSSGNSASLSTLQIDIKGGNQPPGTGNMARRLQDSLVGTTAASSLAGEQTLNGILPNVPLRGQGPNGTTQVLYDKGLAARLEAGDDRVRVNLTAYELLAGMQLTYTAGVSKSIDVSLKGADGVQLVAPTPDKLEAAVAVVAAVSRKDLVNRDEIVAQANDAGLFFGRALTLNGKVVNKHFLYLFDVLELVLARPLYEAKLYLDVPRPSTHSLGSSITPMVPIPNHQSFPSGHASYAWAIAELMVNIMEFKSEQQTYLFDLAAHIAANREDAGLHTVLDSGAGELLGTAVGRWMAIAAKDAKTYPKWATLMAQAQVGW
jgi:hypothetical protein